MKRIHDSEEATEGDVEEWMKQDEIIEQGRNCYSGERKDKRRGIRELRVER